MSYVTNTFKRRQLETHGHESSFPLFDSAPGFFLPDWIWDGKEVKREVLNKMEGKFAHDSQIYLVAMLELGGEATDHQVKDRLGWDLHIVSARRNDLKRLGIIESYPDKKEMGPHGMPNTVWYVNMNRLQQRLSFTGGE